MNNYLFYAREKASKGNLLFCGNRRTFKLSIRTLDNNEILKLRREFHCGRKGCFCCGCVEICHQDLLVYSGENTITPGRYLGRVKERFSFCQPVFNVFDDDGIEIYRIIGDTCSVGGGWFWGGSTNYNMKVYQNTSPDGWGNEGVEIGEMQRQYSGLTKELFTDIDNFFIQFPPNANADQKSLLIGALFLIEILFFDGKSNGTSSSNNSNSLLSN
ncbi:hypothetical protein CYY_010020 [Polysphondylium violaceum]|uniref:Phospholipid scramblase n=1 Tax=Polysphondylium violaceum TaxID=133409 RepID=A0A8J4UP32_9MYCE|nr:hypothetical protein CYY_010020 [Polysphondylium violaceum]